MTQHYRIKEPEGADQQGDRKKRKLVHRALAGALAIAILTPAVFVLPGHVRLALINQADIVISPIESGVAAGAPVTIEIFVEGHIYGAGIHLSGTGIQGDGRVEPIVPGWNSYTRIATGSPGWQKIEATLHSADGFDTAECWHTKFRPDEDRWIDTDSLHDICRARGRATMGLSVIDPDE